MASKASNREWTLELLEVAFATPPTNRGQWILLLGDNGTGKSTILRSLVLGLADLRLGSALLEGLRGLPLVRHGAKKAKITVELAGETVSRTVRVVPDSAGRGERFKANGNTIRVPVFGYGCHRMTTRGSVAAGAEVRSLFAEDPVLVDGEVWLQKRYIGKLEEPDGPRARFFDAVRNTLLELLPGVEEIEVQDVGVG